MPLLKKLLITIFIVFGAIFVVSRFLPSKWSVERSITIQAPAKDVFPFINDLHRWTQWYPWSRDLDVSMVSIYEGAETGEGSVKKWSGSEIKNGEIKIVKSVLNEGVWYTFKSDQSSLLVNGSLILKKAGDSKNDKSVEVIWTDSGNTGSSIIARISAGGLDAAVGPKFEEGLKNLKKIAEESSGKKH